MGEVNGDNESHGSISCPIMIKEETMPKPFILRSSTIVGDAKAHQRREEIISEMSEVELDQIAGGTNGFDISPEWDPGSGGDHSTSNSDPVSTHPGFDAGIS
ncbi:hypothetical protein [Eilatimonas milleporae]|nr:hypothetical protein [Eilatimonas milleporae]